jgi:exosortase A
MTVKNQTIRNTWPASENSWGTAMLCLILSLVILSIAFFDTFTSIVHTWWKSGTFAHGFLVLPIVAFLIWKKRSTLRLITPTPRKSALLLVLVLLLVWFFAYILNVLVVMQFSVMSLIVALVWMFLGDSVVSKLAFPLGYLFFAVPFGDFLIPTLQDITALLAVKALQFSSIPVYLEGRYFYIPSGSFEVAEGCSGVRYLIASVCLGTLYSYLSFVSIKRRILFIVFCTVVPILANAIRAYGIVMIAHLSSYKYAVGVDHIIYGWIFFGVVIFFVFWVGSFFRDKNDMSQDTNIPIPGKALKACESKARADKISYISLTLAVTMIMLVGSWWINSIYSSPEDGLSVNVSLPKGEAGWQGPAIDQSMWKPKFIGATYEQQVIYISGNRTVNVFVGYYGRQKQGAELISASNRIFGEKWKRVSEATTTIDDIETGPWEINEVVLTSARENRIVWFWYNIGGYRTPNRILAKIMELPVRLLKQNKGSSIIAVSTKYDLDVEKGRRHLKKFLNNMMLPLQAILEQRTLTNADTNP